MDRRLWIEQTASPSQLIRSLELLAVQLKQQSRRRHLLRLFISHEKSACLFLSCCYLRFVVYILGHARQTEAVVAEKQFVDFLGDSLVDRIRCTFETHRGKVIKIKVVQYETRLRGKWMPVVCYDMAHGFFHRDVYFFGSPKQVKQFVSKPNLEEALTYAIQDLRDNWPIYKLTFLGEGNGKDQEV